MIKYFDGGMGTMLNLAAGELPEQLNITDPERVLRVHTAYAEAGADIITANTFGANPLALRLRKKRVNRLRLTSDLRASYLSLWATSNLKSASSFIPRL